MLAQPAGAGLFQREPAVSTDGHDTVIPPCGTPEPRTEAWKIGGYR